MELVVALDANTKEGLLSETSGDLRALTGHATKPIADTVAEVVKSLCAAEAQFRHSSPLSGSVQLTLDVLEGPHAGSKFAFWWQVVHRIVVTPWPSAPRWTGG